MIEGTDENFLERLQKADESVKRRWVVAIAIMAMIIVVFVWLKYFNNLLARLSTAPRTEVAGENTAPGYSFFETMKGGAATVYDVASDEVGALRRALSAQKNYTVTPKQ